MQLSPPSFQNIFITSKRNSVASSFHSPSSPTPKSLASNLMSVSLQLCLFWAFRITGILRYVAFCVSLLSLTIMFSKFFVLVSLLHSFFKCLFIYLFWRERGREGERQRENEQAGEGQRERETENLKQAPRCQNKAQCGAQTHKM